MSLTKRPLLRYTIIDRELSKRSRVKTKHIQEILLHEFDHQISTRVIQQDIEAMRSDSQLGYFAPIDYDHKTKAYYYTDPEYTIRKFGLKEEEVDSLRLTLTVLKQYSSYGVLQMLVSAIEKIESALQIEQGTEVSDLKVWDRFLVEPLSSVSQETAQHIPVLVKAIEQKRKIRFEYKKFEEAETSWRTYTPAWLKEYEGLWYLIVEEERGKRKTFALDRIIQVEVLEERGEARQVDIDAYYQYCMGITNTQTDPVTLVISVAPYQGNYIKTLPIHPTQTILEDNEQELRISITVIPSYELYAKLLSYGATLTVISPQFVRDELVKMLQQSLKNYSS